MPIEAASTANQSKRERSPSFPYLDLQSAVDFLGKLYKEAKMNEVRLADVAAAWQMSEGSGSFLRYISALVQFGLIDSLTSGDVRKVKVSVSGRRILEDARPGVREDMLAQAALQPKLIRGLFYGEDGMNVWAQNRPSDAIAESYLKLDLMFSQDTAKRFINVYDATIQFVSHAAEPNDSEVALETHGFAQEAIEVADMHRSRTGLLEVVKETAPPDTPLGLNDISFKSEGPGVVSISAKLDVNGLDLLARKIAALKMLLE